MGEREGRRERAIGETMGGLIFSQKKVLIFPARRILLQCFFFKFLSILPLFLFSAILMMERVFPHFVRKEILTFSVFFFDIFSFLWYCNSFFFSFFFFLSSHKRNCKVIGFFTFIFFFYFYLILAFIFIKFQKKGKMGREERT